MGRPYSFDLRERVAAAVVEGESCRVAAMRFSVSVASAVRWSRRVRETGSPAALPVGGHRPFKLAGEADWVRARLLEKPDITLRSLVAELAERKVMVTLYAVWHFLKHAGLSFKKKPARRRAGAARRGAPARALEAPPSQA